MTKAHRSDILVVGQIREQRDWYPMFELNQIHSVSRRTRLRGVHFRTAWFTKLALDQKEWPETFEYLLQVAHAIGGKVQYIENWEPEPDDLLAKIAALPEANACASMDFGRGYAKAIKDVLALIAQEVQV